MAKRKDPATDPELENNTPAEGPEAAAETDPELEGESLEEAKEKRSSMITAAMIKREQEQAAIMETAHDLTTNPVNEKLFKSKQKLNDLQLSYDKAIKASISATVEEFTAVMAELTEKIAAATQDTAPALDFISEVYDLQPYLWPELQRIDPELINTTFNFFLDKYTIGELLDQSEDPDTNFSKALESARRAKETAESRRYRTRTAAAETRDLAEIPNRLAVITLNRYRNSLSFFNDPDSIAYLENYRTLDGMRLDDGQLYFDSMTEYSATLQDLKTKEGITELDLPTLKMFYSIILKDAEKQPGNLPRDIVSVYVPDFAKMIGKGSHKENYQQIIEITKSFHNVLGIVEHTRGQRVFKDHYPILNFEGYDESNNTLSFSSPYMNYLIRTILQKAVSVSSKTGKPLLNHNGEAKTKASHSYLIHPDIVGEKNKAAVENVMLIVALIEEAGPDNIPRISAETLIEKNAPLQQRLATSKNKRQLLKRVFQKTWELLQDKTDLKAVYNGIKLPDPKFCAAYIPTETNMKTLVFSFPHNGKIKK